jgi:hypothetical protein
LATSFCLLRRGESVFRPRRTRSTALDSNATRCAAPFCRVLQQQNVVTEFPPEDYTARRSTHMVCILQTNQLGTCSLSPWQSLARPFQALVLILLVILVQFERGAYRWKFFLQRVCQILNLLVLILDKLSPTRDQFVLPSRPPDGRKEVDPQTFLELPLLEVVRLGRYVTTLEPAAAVSCLELAPAM